MTGKRRAAGPPETRKPTSKAAKPKRTWKQRLGRLALWGTVGLVVVALIGAGAFYYLYRTTPIPTPNEDFETQTSFVYYADGKTEVGSFATQRRTSIPYGQMPQTVKDAVVAAENQTFWTDSGIDVKGILRAVFNNASGNSTQGASTITQQYVKVMYLTQEQSYKRKLKEAILALKLQRQVSKTELLQNYLNTIYFGRGAYGVQAAAKAYFDKPARRLTLRQSAVLAAVLNNPSRFDPANGKANKRALKGRYEYVLDSMLKMGTIDAAEHDQAIKRLPKFPEIDAQSSYGDQKGHVLTLVRDQLHALGYTDDQIDGGGLRVTTTLTPEAMKANEDGIISARPDGFGDKQLHAASASVEVGTGKLLGFYAGQDFLDSQINWATAGGMVGSTMKPITLTAALQAGFSLKDRFAGNSPFEFPDGLKVRNEGTGPDGEGEDYGTSVDAITAMEKSINTAFVDMSNSIPDGPKKIYAEAEKMGIPPTEADDAYPGIPSTSRDLSPDDTLITLGRARVSPINMANTYATIANGGERVPVHLIESVESTDGQADDYSYKQSQEKAMSSDIASDVSYSLQENVTDGTGQAAQAIGRPAAGKTGTATNDKDEVSSAWFVGYTPQVSTAVMYVRGDGDDQLDGWLPSYFGADYPTDTWAAIMEPIMAGRKVEDFPEPAYVDGTAPTSGHDPSPTLTPQPTKKASPTTRPSPTKSSSPTSSSTPTKTPSPTASSSGCSGILCNPSDSPSSSGSGGSSPSPSASSSGGASASPSAGGNPNGRQPMAEEVSAGLLLWRMLLS
ncbi:transglycosylase domain-containing protein [Nocardioides acrostichi]|uniref:Penicillin-binding protein n=1 Tax=Nocardioides acrostichi TaxID=2784339 RepID=A0A930V4X7_9ACTN|nr:transglycosylase domain-containing protein [Nocardioides acrostichi]MBF4163922.1 penicillin-binding protein [Nocardioides acrostichi]